MSHSGDLTVKSYGNLQLWNQISLDGYHVTDTFQFHGVTALCVSLDNVLTALETSHVSGDRSLKLD